MFLYDKTNILEGLGIFEVDFAHGHEPASVVTTLYYTISKKIISFLAAKAAQ